MRETINSTDHYRYKCENIDFSLWIKIRGFLKGFFGRKNALRVFCQKNKIEYPVNPSTQHSFPNIYLIENSEIAYIAKIRDRIILGLHDDYSKKQQENDIAIEEVNSRIANDKNVLTNENKKLERYKKQLEKTNDHSEKLWLESEVATTEASISNMRTKIASEETEKAAYEQTKLENIDSWKKQIDIVRVSEETRNNQFILNLTKKITAKLGYKEFKYSTIQPSASVSKIMNGEYNVSAK